jgi:hypothetical protein
MLRLQLNLHWIPQYRRYSTQLTMTHIHETSATALDDKVSAMMMIKVGYSNTLGNRATRAITASLTLHDSIRNTSNSGPSLASPDEDVRDDDDVNVNGGNVNDGNQPDDAPAPANGVKKGEPSDMEGNNKGEVVPLPLVNDDVR